MEVLRRIPSSPAIAVAEALNQKLTQLIKVHKTSSPVSTQLPAALMRSGTSKGLFVHRRNLPQSTEKWAPILSAAMGSSDADKRQLGGVGGASSTTSKAAIISPSLRPDADVDYTFAQIAVGQNKVDIKGSCGNICSGVGPFAIDEGLVRAQRGSPTTTVRVHDTNTGALIEQHIHVDPATGRFDPQGDFSIPGYAGAGSPITLSWKDAAGTVGRRQLFPSGNRADTISVKVDEFDEPVDARATLIDAANPFVFVDADSLPLSLLGLGSDNPAVLSVVEAIRCRAAVLYGLASTPEEAHKTRAIPKVVILHQPSSSPGTEGKTTPDIRAAAYTMGKPHPSFQLTGVLCLSAALTYPGTVAAEIARRACGQNEVENAANLDPALGDASKLIAHPSGVARAVVTHSKNADGSIELDKISVTTTAERLFSGDVYVGNAAKKGLGMGA